MAHLKLVGGTAHAAAPTSTPERPVVAAPERLAALELPATELPVLKAKPKRPRKGVDETTPIAELVSQTRQAVLALEMPNGKTVKTNVLWFRHTMDRLPLAESLPHLKAFLDYGITVTTSIFPAHHQAEVSDHVKLMKTVPELRKYLRAFEAEPFLRLYAS